MGTKLSSKIKDMLKLQKSLALKLKVLDQWKQISYNSLPIIKKYAPTTYAELLGMSKVIPLEDLLLLVTDYEMQMILNNTKKCTAFAATFPSTINSKLINGQTDDEEPSQWNQGKEDIILHLNDKKNNITSLIFTHPGIPAYMGINSDGISILWTYIDNNQRDFENGLPTNVIIREALTKKSLEEVFYYIKNVPKSVPNNFVISQEDNGIYNLEVSPNTFSYSFNQNGYTSHTNHFVIDNEMSDFDKSVAETSRIRYKKIRKLLKKYNGKISVEVAKKMLSEKPIKNIYTITSLIFSEKTMHIRYNNQSNWKSYKV